MSSSETSGQGRGNLKAFADLLTGYSNRFFKDDVGMSRRIFWLLFAIVACVGAFYRFWHGFTNSLWMDEAVTAGLARLPLHVLMFNNVDFHPPLSFVVQHFWQKLVPDPQFYRMPVVVAGSVSVLLLMLALKDVLSRPAAIVSGLFLALMTGHIFYSQDLRMYPFVALGVVIALWGALGMTERNRSLKHRYMALYVLGGAIAIYSQVIGLIAMSCVGFASLGGGLIAHRQSRAAMFQVALTWLIANLILLVVAVPFLLALGDTALSHSGLGLPKPVTELPWHFRLMVGYPGLEALGGVRDIAELLSLCVAMLGAGLAWMKGRFSISLMILGLVVFYPIMIGVIHMQKQIIHVRIFIPCTIGVALGMGYAVASLANIYARRAGVAVFASFALASSTFEQLHHFSIENWGEGFEYLDEVDYADAPILSCFDFSAAALWEARSSAEIIVYSNQEAYRYPGPEYWGLMGRSIGFYTNATTRERGEFVNKSDYFEGGLKEALAGRDKVVVAHAGCFFRPVTGLRPELEGLGFREVLETQVIGSATPYPIIVGNGSHIHLFERVAQAE